MEGLSRDVTAGAVGGLAGGIVLTGAMIAADRFGIEKPLPLKVERWAAYHAGADRASLKRDPDASEEALAYGGHLAASLALGAAFGAMQGRVDVSPTVSGLLFGLGVHAINLGLIGPALTITKKPWNKSPSLHAGQLAMHAVFGVVAALVARNIARRL
jgi:H+/Cl- antiporter ClcA